MSIIKSIRVQVAKALLSLGKRMIEEAPEKAEKGVKVTHKKKATGRSGQAHEPLLNIELADRLAYDPININSTFHNGHLYYPIQTLVRIPHADDQGNVIYKEQTDVVVVRSDRTVHRAVMSEGGVDSSGARSQVYRLSDGTLIERPPQANPHGTWSYESVAEYLNGAGDNLQLGGLARSVHQHLYSRIWLPYPEDYWLLTFIVITSYVQSIFDAVPLCLVCGPGGSGKSELGNAIQQVSANAVMIGQTSPATMMRLIDESGGLTIIDDLEAIGARGRGNKNEKFSDIAQALKVSYKKTTAKKLITDSNGKTRQLNFFGVKILNNTSGASGHTLGSRMVRVYTQYLPENEKKAFLARTKIPEYELVALRNQLHTWAMSHVKEIHSAYMAAVSGKTMREEEIAVPLQVLAEMAGDKNGIEGLRKALERDDIENMEPDDLLLATVQKLAVQGYREITPQHVILEMRLAYEMTQEEFDLAWLKPEWVGRRMRNFNLTDDTDVVRKRLHGTHLRVMRLDDHYLADQMRKLDAIPTKKDALDFCDSCKQCRYANVGCEIMVKRWQKTG